MTTWKSNNTDLFKNDQFVENNSFFLITRQFLKIYKQMCEINERYRHFYSLRISG